MCKQGKVGAVLLRDLEPGVNFSFKFDCNLQGESNWAYRVVEHGRYGRFYVEIKHPRTSSGLPGELFDFSPELCDKEVVVLD